MADKAFKKEKESEELSKEIEKEQEQTKEENKENKSKDNNNDNKNTKESKEKKKEPGFWSRSWNKIKTGAGNSKKKFVKAISKEPEDMSEEEFDKYLQEEEAEGNEGYASRYYSLIEELKQMPSLMSLSKDAESKDIAEAVSKNPKLDKEDKEQVDDVKGGKTESESESDVAGKSQSNEKSDKDLSAENKTESENKSIDNTLKEKTAKTASKKESEVADKLEINKKDSNDSNTESKIESESHKNSESQRENKSEPERKENEGGVSNTLKEKSEKTVGESEGEAADKSKSESNEKGEEDLSTENKAESESSENPESEKEESTLNKIMDFKEDGIDLGNNAVSIYKSSKRRKALEALESKADPKSTQARQLSYMKDQAKKESTSNGFNIAQNVLGTVNKAIGKFGSEKVKDIASKISKCINMALNFGKDIALKKLEKKSIKNGLEGLLGGSEVYNKLKDKYKLNGGTMRRAIRVAANRSSMQDLIDADKDKLSEQYEENVQKSDENTLSFMGLAGGKNAQAAKKSMGRSVVDTKEKKEEQEGI